MGPRCDSFVVTATVNSCTDLGNVALASWGCGNDDGTGTTTNPVSVTTAIAYILKQPHIEFGSVSDINVPYCSAGVPVTVTVNNTGEGPALNFGLDSDLESLGAFTVTNISPNWTYNPATGVFSYTAGTLDASSAAVLTFTLSPAGCSLGSGSVTFDTLYSNACGTSFPFPSASASYNYAPDHPSPSLTKSGPATALTGETVVFQVDLTADYIQNISGSIHITDVIPSSAFSVTAASVTAGTLGPITSTLNWVVTPTGSGSLTATLLITATVKDDLAECEAYDSATNNVNAWADVTCPPCDPLTASASRAMIIQNLIGSASYSKSVVGSGEVCTVFTITNFYEYLFTAS